MKKVAILLIQESVTGESAIGTTLTGTSATPIGNSSKKEFKENAGFPSVLFIHFDDKNDEISMLIAAIRLIALECIKLH
jgi:hypothetical protein